MKPERTLRSRTVFKGRRLDVRVLTVKTGKHKTSQREIVYPPDAVAVLCVRPDGRLVFVQQFRKALEQTLFEIVAGGIEPHESPATAARREVREETGYSVRTLTRLGCIYPAPGYTSEALHVYFARLDGTQGALDPDEDEHIRVVAMSPAQFDALIAAGKVADAKALAAWMLYLRLKPHATRRVAGRR